MLTRLRQWLAAPVFQDEEETRIAGLLNTVLVSALVLAVVAAILMPLVLNPLTGWLVVAVWVAIMGGSLFLLRLGRVRLAGGLFTLAMWTFSTTLTFLSGGIGNASAAGYVTITILASLLLGSRGAVAFAGLSLLGALGLLIAELNGLLVPSTVYQSVVGRFIGVAVNIAMGGVLLFLASRDIARALSEARGYAAELEAQRGRLEEMVDTRTRQLTRRARSLEATAEVSSEITATLSVEELLPRIIATLTEHFGFYRMGIFLLDETGDSVVLRAASREVEDRLLGRDFQVAVDGMGTVARVVSTGRAYVVADVANDPVYLPVAEVADTRSEVTLPLRARGATLGAISIQSSETNAFDAEDVAVLQTVADQVALAISNARLFQQAQEGLEAERRAYGQLSLEAWRELLRTQPELAIVRGREGISALDAALDVEVQQALKSGQAVVGDTSRAPSLAEDGSAGSLPAGGGEAVGLAVPIRVRGQVIGAIDAHKPLGSGAWTPEQVSLLESLTEQIGDALEDARLYRDAQQRAARERTLAEVTGRMRESMEVDAILQNAVREMRQALGAQAVEIYLVEAEQ